MIITTEIEIEARALESSIGFMIAGIKVIQLNSLSNELSLNDVCQGDRIALSLILNLLDVIIAHILIRSPCDGIMVS